MSTQGAGPQLNQEQYPAVPVSPLELLEVLLNELINVELVPATDDAGNPHPVWVGGAENTAQQDGCVVLMASGTTQSNPHLPIHWARIQVRCMAHSLSHAEQIGLHVYDLLHVRHRTVVTQPSTNNSYVIHHTECVGGPSLHFDSVTTWESLAFYLVQVNTFPIS